ncbi:MAG TPA: radical SAM protein [Verrucomicrobiae bacterium]|jgi:DNA repair photolyase|nr:radical SAM protein [Verrucomicrobiae bacterium]
MATATSIPMASTSLPLKRKAPRGPRVEPTPTLFPDVPNQGDSGPALSPPGSPERVGIARLALSSPLADAKRGTEYFLLPVKSILNHCDSTRVPFSWTVNPYRGCEFGCKYCYARYTHEYMELDGQDFEKKIYVKQGTGPLAGRDLGKEKVWGEHIAIGTATDPYQPAEREFGATRAILEQMAARKGLSVSITTKSDQVVRDIDLLRRIGERSGVSVNLSITTLRTRLARILEPRAPRPDLRLKAVQELRRAGIAAGVFAMPILPGLTDREEDLDALARAAKDAGAQWFAGSVLFLMPSAKEQFLPFLDAKFPKLARRYREWFAREAYAPEEYRQEIAERIRALRRKYGLGVRPLDPGRTQASGQQLSLGLE